MPKNKMSLARGPDVVIVATGGLPNVGDFEGKDLAATSWDILSGATPCGEDILLFDENGSHAGLSCAEYAATTGSKVRIVTPERYLGRELGGTNVGAHLNEIYQARHRDPARQPLGRGAPGQQQARRCGGEHAYSHRRKRNSKSIP